jgi:uncharacterized RDD family membrane protein YckC
VSHAASNRPNRATFAPAGIQRASEARAETAAPPFAPEYVGLVTRAIAFALDAALINLIAIVVAAAVGLALSVLSVPDAVSVVAIVSGCVAFVAWTIGYFVTFWSTTGQTPGNRVLRIKVTAADGGRLLPRRALVRFAGLTLAAIPLFAGFALILFDDRRRGLQDLLARSVVVEVERDAEVSGSRP